MKLHLINGKIRFDKAQSNIVLTGINFDSRSVQKNDT